MKNLLKHAFALSAATVFGGAVVASPAQAGKFVGSLAFSNGADDWFSEVTPGAGDTFDIEFNPLGINFVTTQNGFFTPPFDGYPVQGVAPSVGEFEYVSSSGSEFIYALTNDLVFAYDNGASVTWEAGTEFMGVFNGLDTIEFQLAKGQGILVMVDGIGETDFSVIAETLQFSDTDAPGGGTYNAQVDLATPIPEPTVLFGLGVVTAGLVTSRRQKNS
ncbi:MAG: PEP-CTERM sorting domain-containing protein [Okeania sp. SIO3B5]|uniref:PEP-CTERM sorting domain-containing protein n=1 Tax=Okeania sp. SIO3B5 TaxID=2607811 RepID=UPI0013FF5DD5|nr:PEP-CTERM sorting domain-containing protein [Okeania sp. SIO3B5]NEO57351.1 PEP-CTERM sorting domain-containing protein [Okeania sp. SIO3B5]